MHSLTTCSYTTDAGARDLGLVTNKKVLPSLPFYFVERESHLRFYFYECLENRCEARKHTRYLVS